MKICLAPIIASLLLGTATVVKGEDEDQERHVRSRQTTQRGGEGAPFAMAVFGDWPYSQALLDNHMRLVDSVNAYKDVVVVAHLGDIHSGSMPCTGAGYNGPATLTSTSSVPSGLTLPVVNPLWNVHVYDALQKFNAAVVYTPGDNEWADCHKAKQYSSGAPLAELQGVRELFFSPTGSTMGKLDKTVRTQAWSTVPSDQKFVENVMWHERQITFATFNVPGGSNDNSEISAPWTGVYADPAAQKQERLERESANLRWLDYAFDMAARKRSRAVVIMLQADLWDPEKATALDNYTPFVQKLAARTLALQVPVLVLNGDSHIYKVDQPLVPNGAAGPYMIGCDLSDPPTCDLSKLHGDLPAVPNLLRITVQGSDQPGGLSWLKVTIRPLESGIYNVFQYENVCYENCP